MNLGPDGMFLVYALAISAVAAVLTWLRVTLRVATLAVIVVGVALAVVQYASVEQADTVRESVRASFILVPTVLLVVLSRLRWLVNRAWTYLVLGPILFVGCYVGICELCVRAKII
jgi:hypothetical protein